MMLDLRVEDLPAPALVIDRSATALHIIIARSLTDEELRTLVRIYLTIPERDLVRAHLGMPSVAEAPERYVRICDIPAAA